MAFSLASNALITLVCRFVDVAGILSGLIRSNRLRKSRYMSAGRPACNARDQRGVSPCTPELKLI